MTPMEPERIHYFLHCYLKLLLSIKLKALPSADFLKVTADSF